MHNPTAQRQGLMLVELLLAIAIIAILLTIGIGGLGPLIAKNRRVTEVNTLVGLLQLARSESIKRATAVTVSPAEDATNHHPGYPGANDDLRAWQAGYAVRTAGGNVLRAQPGSRNDALMISSTRGGVTFQPDGSAGASNLTFFFCDRHHLADPRAVVVSGVGRVRIADTYNGSPIPCP